MFMGDFILLQGGAMPSILVIDDKDSMSQMLYKTLESEGYEVETAKDGEGGLEKAKENCWRN